MGAFGVGNGAVFQLVGLRYRERIGVLTGLVGAAGGLGGFFLPTILGTRARRLRLLRAGHRRDRGGRRRRAVRDAGRARRPGHRPGRSAGMRTLVVGGGIAGQAVLEAIRERDPRAELTLVCAEPRLPVRPRRALDAAGQRRRPGHAHAAAGVLVRGPARSTVPARATRRRDARHRDALRPRRPVHRLGRARAADPRRRRTPTSSAGRRTAPRSPAARGPSAPS